MRYKKQRFCISYLTVANLRQVTYKKLLYFHQMVYAFL